MGKINLLEPRVFNMLAAGEVVERPSSVVKELVENAIDAGATSIEISVEEGGARLIEVSDNGIGIQKEDMRAAFLPHATSKIKNIVDLDSLSTLGFRGEALASIASVSEVTLISKSKGESVAAKISLSGGKVTYEGLDSRNEGTVVSVENLFFNTPARKKFLKKPAAELRYIEDVVRQQILANPSVAFTLIADGEVSLRHEGGELFDAICSVMGVKIAEKLILIEDFSQNGIRVGGYVSSPDCTRPNRNFQTMIVNGRVVEDQTVQLAAEKAYGETLMKRSYPAFVLDIVMPFDQVDVNVHPSKTEVRFFDKQAVFSAVYHAVSGVVRPADGFKFDVAATDEQQQVKKQEAYQPRFDLSSLISPASGYYKQAPQTLRETGISAFSPDFSARKQVDNDLSADIDDGGIKDMRLDDKPIMGDEGEIHAFDGKIIGQIFSTYILVERDETAYIIDQHAAHERILYDRIVERMKPEYSQPMLVPYKLILSASECEYFETLTQSLEEMGFKIERNGANYLLTAVPEPVSRLNFATFFKDLFTNYAPSEQLSLADVMHDSLCQQACKAAIKGGETLSREQIERVIRTLDKDGKLPTQCPHGRPCVFAFSKTDIEKLFKRIV